jgi:hypothetical protein
MNFFFDTTITVEHLADSDSGTIKEAYTAGTTIYGMIQRISADDVMLSDGDPAKSAVLYVPYGSDLRDHDRITADGIKYIVKGAANQKGTGRRPQYMKAIIEKMRS